MGNRLFTATDPSVLELFFVPTDPRHLERFKRLGFRRGRPSRRVRALLGRFRRALQVLPPRELDMLFSTEVREGVQEQVSGRFHVLQSNVSYRVDRAKERVVLHMRIHALLGETHLRDLLSRAGVSRLQVQVVTGFYRTENQSVTARHLGLTQGVARSLFLAAEARVLQSPVIVGDERKRVLRLFRLLKNNFNRLRIPESQDRWRDKIGGTNYASATRLLTGWSVETVPGWH
jgi:hypothetical protein